MKKTFILFFTFVMFLMSIISVSALPPAYFHINGTVVDNETGAPISGAVLTLTAPGETLSSGSNTDTTDANGYYEIDAYFEPGDPGNTWTLRVEHDVYISQEISIPGDVEVIRTDDFSLVKRLSTDDIHFVNSSGMESDVYYRGEDVFIWISLKDQDGNALPGENIYFTDPNGNLILMNDNHDGTYSYTYHINYNDPLGTWTVQFFQNSELLNSVDLTILAVNLTIVFNQPSQGDIFNRGETIPIDVFVTYPDGSDVDTGSVNATINGDVITLTNPSHDSEWTGSYTLPNNAPEGNLVIQIDANDGFDNTGQNSTTVNVNATLFVNITSPNDGDTFSKGQVVTVTAEVRDIHGNLLSGANVIADGPNVGNNFVLVEISPGIYSADYHTSSGNPSGVWNLFVTATKNGNSGSDSIGVNLETPANLAIVHMSTNLSRHEYCNQGQTYELYVNVTNSGEAVAENVNVSLTSSVGSTISPTTVQLGDISQGQVETATFIVTCSQTLGLDTLTATSSGTDENSGDVTSTSDSIDVMIQQGAGGDDGELELNGTLGSGVWINPSLINGQGMQAEVTVVVANDGDVPVTSTSITATIHEGSCSGSDVTTQYFDLTQYLPASADIANMSTQTYTFNISTTSAHSGDYVVCVTASGIDANDGSVIGSDEGYAFFSVDADAPMIILNYPDNNTLTNVSNVNFGFTVSDNSATNIRVELYIDGLLENSSTFANPYTGELSATLQDGVHTWHILAYDDVGNVAQSEVRTLVVDTTPPQITLTSPAEGSHEGPSVIFNFTATDAITLPSFASIPLAVTQTT